MRRQPIRIDPPEPTLKSVKNHLNLHVMSKVDLKWCVDRLDRAVIRFERICEMLKKSGPDCDVIVLMAQEAREGSKEILGEP